MTRHETGQPGRTGLNPAAELRADPQFDDAAIVFLSAATQAIYPQGPRLLAGDGRDRLLSERPVIGIARCGLDALKGRQDRRTGKTRPVMSGSS